MKAKQILAMTVMSLLAAWMVLSWKVDRSEAGETGYAYKVLDPITRGNLSVFPVISDQSHDTKNFLTLDEGVRSGQVVVSEAGSVQPLIRGPRPVPPRGGAEVNRLVLVNNSGRPLILLAGEIVTGGKQDRVVGKDRIVPANSDPVDLGVFCVEPGRWVATKSDFGTFQSQMAQPSVRRGAMADQNQQKVWAEVHASAKAMEPMVSAPAAEAIGATSSYAGVMNNEEVKRRVDSVAQPLEQSYRGLMRELRDRHAVGVVVAVNDEIIWADLFASTGLLQKYWPKLIRSYAAESLTRGSSGSRPGVKAAQSFLDEVGARRETVETEPGVYRRTEHQSEGFVAFELTSLLPGTGYDLHIAKMVQ